MRIPDMDTQPQGFKEAFEDNLDKNKNDEDQDWPPVGRVCCAHLVSRIIPGRFPSPWKFREGFVQRLRAKILSTIWQVEAPSTSPSAKDDSAKTEKEE